LRKHVIIGGRRIHLEIPTEIAAARRQHDGNVFLRILRGGKRCF
jgi:hypothetical protein